MLVYWFAVNPLYSDSRGIFMLTEQLVQYTGLSIEFKVSGEN